MEREKIQQLLEQVKNGISDIDEAVNALHQLDGEKLGFACLDHHRFPRTGIPEVVFGENKTAAQIVEIFSEMLARSGAVMATRVSVDKSLEVQLRVPGVVYYPDSRLLVARAAAASGCRESQPLIVIVSAGTSDVQVSEEAKNTLECLGHRVESVFDVGVAGIHRLYDCRQLLCRAAVLIIVAGMEGALPSVVAGLVAAPIIAVPTSVGYGTGLGGIAALLGMLNSCTPGIAVVNIDNGFGAACMASRIVRRWLKDEKRQGES